MSRITNKATTLRLSSIDLFCRAAALGSFAAAAKASGITPSAVSRAVARLESHLDTSLFVRTTRKLALTDDGALYFAQCQQALSHIADAEQTIRNHGREASGLLRVSLPTTYAHYRVLPRLHEFTARHPRVELELNVVNRQIDFVEEGYDLAIRLGEPPDSGLIGRKLEDAALGIYAAPAYLAAMPPIEHIADLDVHRCLQFILPSSNRPMPWILMTEGRPVEYRFNAQVRCSDDVLACLTLAVGGSGLFQIYDFIAAPFIRRGELVEAFPSSRGRSRPFYALYPTQRQGSPKLRVFLDFLTTLALPSA